MVKLNNIVDFEFSCKYFVISFYENLQFLNVMKYDYIGLQFFNKVNLWFYRIDESILIENEV